VTKIGRETIPYDTGGGPYHYPPEIEARNILWGVVQSYRPSARLVSSGVKDVGKFYWALVEIVYEYEANDSRNLGDTEYTMAIYEAHGKPSREVPT
jgi:hypothetical protein